MLPRTATMCGISVVYETRDNYELLTNITTSQTRGTRSKRVNRDVVKSPSEILAVLRYIIASNRCQFARGMQYAVCNHVVPYLGRGALHLLVESCLV